MSLIHFKHFIKGRNGKLALRNLCDDMFLREPYYSSMQYRLVLYAIQENTSNRGIRNHNLILINNQRILNSQALCRTRYLH
jgi:hypothetical protein